jgi:hypothetical protein
MFRWLCRVGLHSWVDVRTTGKYRYEVCLRCDDRRVREVIPYGHQPVDIQWLSGGEWSDFRQEQRGGE